MNARYAPIVPKARGHPLRKPRQKVVFRRCFWAEERIDCIEKVLQADEGHRGVRHVRQRKTFAVLIDEALGACAILQCHAGQIEPAQDGLERP
jgi:hypothetical protein